MDWVDTRYGSGRKRRAALPVPEDLPELLTEEQRALLRRWVREESGKPKRETLLAGTSIEFAEALVQRLLDAGWIQCLERLEGGTWMWHAIEWRDLARLQERLGVSSKSQRAEQRQARVDQARAWLQLRRESADERTLDPDLLDELAQALQQLAEDKTLRPALLATRLQLLQAVAAWHDAGKQGLRRDFALHAREGTKAMTEADWRWLEGSFDLERLRITRFAPVAWLAGDLVLHWGGQCVHAAPLHFVALPLANLRRADAGEGPTRWWLIENRTSFERQAQALEPGRLLVWLPGRPSAAWLQAMAHLLALVPAPAWISADADPAGVDIACTAGALWEARGLEWTPHQMGEAELAASRQHWALNEHDRALLDRLLARPGLPPELRRLCKAMGRDGRKAEQEAWL
ncbi:MAG TPA: hypothetical protein VFL86_04795 [Burkholderiaceae bacterium]|nr:hypothetical protein [Burkholderiaceae bacterium]